MFLGIWTRVFGGFLEGYWEGIRRLEKKIGSMRILDFFDESRKFEWTLSFYQVSKFLPNNLQTHQQGI
jgi:hypothetical protein